MNTIAVFKEISSELGPITLVGHSGVLLGLYFAGIAPLRVRRGWMPGDDPVFPRAEAWLDSYFHGAAMDVPLPEYRCEGTAFQRTVWEELRMIRFGATRVYGEIAAAIGHPKAVRAVGAAIGRNPISIMIPCHRVIGATGALTGYSGGLDRKRLLLAHERC
jgi:methylated-DNA-[protein]-cysteine S-methyltransferase